MNDPYKVLGVSPNASDDEIRRAYKELVKRYHPDQYQGNPLADVAEEKMQQINEAFDYIMTQRRGGGYTNSYNGGANPYSSGGYSYGGTQNSYDHTGYGYDSAQIRQLLQSGSVTKAEQMLNTVPQNMRDAEWFFLMGSVCYKRGWLNDAYNNFVNANRMDPTNTEYASAVNQMNRQRGGYMNMGGSPMRGAGRSADMNTACNCCSDLICADCCCECMGGDLIPCC